MTEQVPTDRYAGLREAAANKSAAAQAAAQRAIMALEARGTPVNFKTVAQESGVSKNFLYAHPELRSTITDKRKQPSARITPTSQAHASDEATLATKLAATVHEVKRLRAENTQLRSENEQLRGDLAAERRRR